MQGGLRAFARRTAGVPRFPATQVRRMCEGLRPREQKLLEEDPNLKAYASTKDTVNLIKRIGDVLVLAVVAGATYEIYYRVMERKAAQAEEKK